MRPRVPKNFAKAQPSSPARTSKDTFRLIPSVSPSRSASRSRSESPTKSRSKSPQKKTRDVLILPGASYVQRFPLPQRRNHVGFRLQPESGLESSASTSGPSTNQPGDGFMLTSPLPLSEIPHQQKRLVQFHRWNQEVIPRIVKSYLRYLRFSRNLSSDVKLSKEVCVCAGKSTTLNVTVVRFSGIEKVTIEVCACNPAPDQLVDRGLFPCAPLRPSLAVDIRVLDFVMRLNARISPNNTAWCDTVQDFLQSQGHHLHGKDPLRRRFGNALQWFGVLQNAAKAYIDSVLEKARRSLLSEIDRLPSDEETRGRKCQRIETESENERMRPSEYLRRRCPLCFGGEEYQEGLSSIVCMDACFTQKNNKHPYRDPKLQHPDSMFVSEEDEETMRIFVEDIRPRRTRSNGKAKEKSASLNDDEDGFEGSMKVPRSVLDACERSFTAADETREKASTQFFASTALMGLLCRHDRVLWLVNMTTAGERQHYALALLKKLFEHLPSTWDVGLLYDVACTLERSCINWGFLGEDLPRLQFAISVFHAYGHGWPCQCIYHPRKRDGFGLSDGEGCERLWHSISRLIAYLRVCGHYKRLYTLDAQILHASKENLFQLAHWLVRRYKHTSSKRTEAEIDVKFSMKPPEYLRSQWKEQVVHQTKPLLRQSRNAAKKAVEEALRKRTIRDTLNNRVMRLEEEIINPSSEPYQITRAQEELEQAKEDLLVASKALREHERKLGTDGRDEYKKLATSAFLTARLNAQAVKSRLIAKLQSRKFERDRVERSMRRQMNTSERKIHNHIEGTVSRREPGIEALAKTYRNLCLSMTKMIKEGRAPPNAIAPHPIPDKELFTLDVDDLIWDDVGLRDSDDIPDPPAWLCDEQVRVGIRGILLQDRCDEELNRLDFEMTALRDWFAEEYTVVESSIESLGENDDDMYFHLEERRTELCRLCIVWKMALSVLPNAASLGPWGPSDQDLEAVRLQMSRDSVVGANDEEDEELYEDVDNEDLDDALIACMDALDLTDGRGDMEHSNLAVYEYQC